MPKAWGRKLFLCSLNQQCIAESPSFLETSLPVRSACPAAPHACSGAVPLSRPPSPDRLLVITLGATALQAYDPTTGGMALRLPPAQLLEQALAAMAAQGHAVEAELAALPQRSGAELTTATLCAVRDHALQRLRDGCERRAPPGSAPLQPCWQQSAWRAALQLPRTALLAYLQAGCRPPELLPSASRRGCSAAVLLCGTDTLEEAAFALHLMLADALRTLRTLLCVTGAMLPADQLGGDGARNLRDALRVGGASGLLRGRGPEPGMAQEHCHGACRRVQRPARRAVRLLLPILASLAVPDPSPPSCTTCAPPGGLPPGRASRSRRPGAGGTE